MTGSRQVLIGVGVGPGDPDLVTVKAVRALRSAALVLVPVTDEASAGRAEATVLSHLDPGDTGRVRRIAFTMSDRSGVTPRRAAAWDAAAAAVVEAFDGGAGVVAFATIGDPNVYSTFSYLAQTVQAKRPETVVETIPGITAMQDIAARAGVPLCEGSESLALVSITGGFAAYRAALRAVDTVVAYKGGRHLPGMIDALAAEGRLENAVVGCGLGLPSQRIIPASQLDPAELAPYLTTVLAAPVRNTRGGRL